MLKSHTHFTSMTLKSNLINTQAMLSLSLTFFNLFFNYFCLLFIFFLKHVVAEYFGRHFLQRCVLFGDHSWSTVKIFFIWKKRVLKRKVLTFWHQFLSPVSLLTPHASPLRNNYLYLAFCVWSQIKRQIFFTERAGGTNGRTLSPFLF